MDDDELSNYYQWLRFPDRRVGDEKPLGISWTAFRLMRDLDRRLKDIEKGAFHPEFPK